MNNKKLMNIPLSLSLSLLVPPRNNFSGPKRRINVHVANNASAQSIVYKIYLQHRHQPQGVANVKEVVVATILDRTRGGGRVKQQRHQREVVRERRRLLLLLLESIHALSKIELNNPCLLISALHFLRVF